MSFMEAIKQHSKKFNITNSVEIGGDKAVLLSGPCVIENKDLCLEVATTMRDICADLGIGYVFKASFDKANRTSVGSFRGDGLEKGLEILAEVKNTVGVPVVTDVHETHQIEPVSKVVDVLQIPAFLCRQTDLLLAAGESGCTVNIKKGQFMDPAGMQFAVNKVLETQNQKVILTERGASFGYNTLVVDYRGLPAMRQFCPVIFDVTHSVQQPGGMGGKSGGQREYAPYLAKAAAAVGVDGFFVETHPNPDKALSDGPNMIPLHEMRSFLTDLLKFWNLHRSL